MPKKQIVIVAVVIGLLTLVGLYLSMQKDTSTVKVSITAPDTFEQGQLILLDASRSQATNLTWKMIPETSNFKIISGGKQALFSGDGSVAVYTIFIAGCKDRKIDSVIHTLSFGKGKIKIGKLNPFQMKLISWIPTNATDEERIRLAQSFKSMATLILNNQLESEDDIIKATAWSNREALGNDIEKWNPFFAELKNELEANPPENHAVKWREIALALDNK